MYLSCKNIVMTLESASYNNRKYINKKDMMIVKSINNFIESLAANIFFIF